jgi:hypothetical protein
MHAVLSANTLGTTSNKPGTTSIKYNQHAVFSSNTLGTSMKYSNISSK